LKRKNLRQPIGYRPLVVSHEDVEKELNKSEMTAKDIRRLKKRIRQIEHLEGARRRLTNEEKAKVAAKDEIRRKLYLALPHCQAASPPPGHFIPSHAEVETGTKRGRSATHEAIHAPLEPLTKKKQPSKRPVMRFRSTRVSGHHHQITRIAYHHDSALVATGTEGASVTVYDASNMTKRATVAGHRRRITGLTFVTKTAQFLGADYPGHAVLISACADGYLIAAHITLSERSEQIDQHYFYSSIASCQMMMHPTGEELIIVSTEDGRLTVLSFREDEFVVLKKFELEDDVCGELTIDKSTRIFIHNESIVRFNIDNIDLAPSEWIVSTQITFNLDRMPTSLAISGDEIFCGTDGDNIRTAKPFRKLRNHGVNMSGVSHRVAVTDQYLISSCRNLLKQESGLTIRSTKPGFAYLGTLTEDIDFGSIRQVWAKENDGKLMIIAASDDAMTVWNEHNEGTRLKVNEDLDAPADDTESENESDTDDEEAEDKNEQIYKTLFSQMIGYCSVL